MTANKKSLSSTYDDFQARFGVAIVFGAVAFVFLWLGGWLFALFMTAISVAMLMEWIGLAQNSETIQPKARQVLIGLGAAGVFGAFFGVPLFLLFAGLGLIVGSFLNGKRLGVLSTSGYLSILAGAAAAIYLRELPAGFGLTLWIVLCVVAADIGGYFFGRWLKGPKLAPSISPKKTWSGFIGGIVLSLAVALVFGISSGGNAASLILFGVLIAVVSVAGDIAESAVKRKVGVKDSGTILKGHGGFLDRLDGMTAVMLFFFVISAFADLSGVFFPNYLAATGAGTL